MKGMYHEYMDFQREKKNRTKGGYFHIINNITNIETSE